MLSTGELWVVLAVALPAVSAVVACVALDWFFGVGRWADNHAVQPDNRGPTPGPTPVVSVSPVAADNPTDRVVSKVVIATTGTREQPPEVAP